MGYIDLFKQNHGAYTSIDAFDVHPTSRHTVADPFPDQLKCAWFRLQNGKESEGSAACYPVDGQGKQDGQVSKCYLDVHEKRVGKLTDNFKTKL